MQHLKYLVIGCSTNETVTHWETGRSRQDVGGVAGQMATALARHGCITTLITPTGRSSKDAGQVIRCLAYAGVKVVPAKAPHRTGHTQITTVAGEPFHTRGSWPSTEDVGESIEEHVKDADWVLVDCTLLPQSLIAILDAAAAHNVPVTINATTKSRVGLILQAKGHPIYLVTANRAEYLRLSHLVGIKGSQGVGEWLNIPNIFVSCASDGWQLDRLYGGVISSLAPTPPDGTDFIGCGDYATAGATCAMALGLPVAESVNQFIETRMGLNVIQMAQ